MAQKYTIDLVKMTAVASGALKADLVLKGGTVVNVFSGKLETADVAICSDRIAGIGNYSAETEIDCRGKFVLPGLIDTHLHIESSMLSPREFARAVIARGTTAMIIDPHEIANVCGMKGVQYMIDELSGLPVLAKVMLPSCVPATPFETSGAVMNAQVIEDHIADEDVFGLGEFMNYVGVVNADPDALAKLNAARSADKLIDGHSMTLNDKSLNAYIAAGIRTDHECISVDDMTARIDRGMYIQLREGCAAKNVAALTAGVTPRNVRRCLFCTDDKHIGDLIDIGHIDHNLRVAVKSGMDPIDAVTIATLNAAECYRHKERGAIAPSYFADMVVVDNLHDFTPITVLFEGKIVAENGESIYTEPPSRPCPIGNSVVCKVLTAADFGLKSAKDEVNTLRLAPHNVVTTLGRARVKRTESGDIILNGGLAKIAVAERHRGTGNMGIGLIEGYGLRSGAIAQTVAHDSHNLIVMGASDADMALAANTLRELGGGLTVVKDGRVLGTLALPIAGLMTDLNRFELKRAFDSLLTAARALGLTETAEPFMTLSFLCLPVIPSIRITDKGLFDVDNFKFLPIEAE